jgi:tetratricopeptide (TPR) repeat protein
VDDTPELGALVPPEFQWVQWTRLPGALPTPNFVEKVKRHLESSAKTATAATPGSAAAPRGSNFKMGRIWPWALAAVAISAAAVGWFKLHPRSAEFPAPSPEAPAPSESGALVARARSHYEKWDFATPADFAASEQLLKRALELDPNDAAAWTSYAIMSCGMLVFNYDDRSVRLPIAVDAAQRAISLAPDSAYAQFALALSYRFQPTTQDESLRRLRVLAARCPTDKFILRNVGATLRILGHSEEAIPYFDRAASLPGGDPIACYLRGIALASLSRFDEAEASVDQALALEPSYIGAMLLKTSFLCNRGDLADAQLEIARLPAGFVVAEDSAALASFHLWEWSRRADKALAAIEGDPHSFLHSIIASGPKTYFAGLADSQDGRADAAEAEWRTALKLIEQRLADNPRSQDDLCWQACLRAHLGDPTGAETSLRLYEESGGGTVAGKFGGSLPVMVDTCVTLGRYDQAMDEIAAQSKTRQFASLFGYLHFSPELDPMREMPRFKELLAEVDAAVPAAAAHLRGAEK